MKISEILVESQQLDEGPILNKIGAGIGKVAGTVAKGVGAVAGGVAGIGGALAKGYKAGKKAVSAGGDDSTDTPEEPAAAPAASGGAAPAASGGAAPAASGGAAPAASGGAAPAASGGAAPAAKPTSTFGKLSAAANGQAPAADPAAGGTQYAQVKANIDKLDKKGKQRILQLLQKEVGTAPAAPTKPAANPGAGAMGAMAGQLAKGGAVEPNTMANAPVSKTNTAKPGNPNAAPAAPKGNYDGDTGEPISDKGRADAAASAAFDASPKGQAQQAKWDAEDAAAAGKTAKKTRTASRVPKKAAPDQATIDAERERIMGPTSDSIIRTRPMMAESFSLFRKR